MRILVTGVSGFIGSTFAKLMVKEGLNVTGFAHNTDQRNLVRIKEIQEEENFKLVFGDLTEDISGILENIDVVVNFAAKTFVDHSVRDPKPFVYSNIVGTYNLLEEARKSTIKLFIQVSTDEVYGAIMEGAYKEDSRLNPTNPYSSSKAAADMLAVSYFNTYKLPLLITRTENNFGPMQHTQKVIPTFVRKALAGEKLPVYGDGKQKRMWLYVDDHCLAIKHLIDRYLQGDIKAGEIFHIAGEQEMENIELAKLILKVLEKDEDQIEFIDDSVIRPNHDRRYAIDTSKLKSTGWKALYSLDEGMRRAITWYRDNEWWFK